MSADAWAVIVAAVALGVSIVTAYKSTKVGNRQNELQERLLALESTKERQRLRQTKSAEVRATIVRQGRGDYRLRIMNQGPSIARNIRTELEGRPMMDHEWLVRQGEPASTLGSGADATYILGISMGSPLIARVRITWEDDSGELRAWESELKI